MPTWLDNELFLSEYHYGFSATRIGFPSISACRAIVYQNANGLFGVHQASGANKDRFNTFANKFAGWVRGHPQGGGAGVNLYVVAKIGAGSSYSAGIAGAKEHLAEIGAIAIALGHHGPILSYDLSYKWAGPGVFVDFELAAGVVTIRGNPWVEHHIPAHKAPLPPARVNDHFRSYAGAANFVGPGNVFIRVDTDNAEVLVPIALPV
jgi:hypothetical protein